MRLAIVSPCYNEHEVLRESAQRLTVLLDGLVAKKKISPKSFVLLVNDGSRDNTWEIISELYAANPYIYGISLAANVGHQNAIMAGMMTAKELCDAVITIDADLQDDLNAVEEMVDRYLEGYDIVYGVKVSREADPFMKRTTAVLYYKLLKGMGVKTVYNHADFRLLSRRALEQLAQYRERNLFLRGLVPLLGLRSTTVDDVIGKRTAGKSKYSLKKMLRLAVDGITSFSVKPMTLILSLGFFFLLVSVVMTIYVLGSFFEGHVVPGWTSLILSVWFIGSILLLAIGIIGQYIGKIYTEVKARPLYHIETVLPEKKNEATDRVD